MSTVQQKHAQETAAKQALIEEIIQLASTVAKSTQYNEWHTSLCVREEVKGKGFKHHKRPARPIDETKRIYLTMHKDIVEPAKPSNGHHKPRLGVDTDHYRPINWLVRNLADVTEIYEKLLAMVR